MFAIHESKNSTTEHEVERRRRWRWKKNCFNTTNRKAREGGRRRRRRKREKKNAKEIKAEAYNEAEEECSESLNKYPEHNGWWKTENELIKHFHMTIIYNDSRMTDWICLSQTVYTTKREKRGKKSCSNSYSACKQSHDILILFARTDSNNYEATNREKRKKNLL